MPTTSKPKRRIQKCTQRRRNLKRAKGIITDIPRALPFLIIFYYALLSE